MLFFVTTGPSDMTLLTIEQFIPECFQFMFVKGGFQKWEDQ